MAVNSPAFRPVYRGVDDARAPSGLAVRLVPAHSLPEHLAAAGRRVLGVVTFGEATGVASAAPTFHVAAPQHGPPPLAELWCGEAPATYAEDRGLRYADGGALVFGGLSRGDDPARSAESTTFELYARLREFIAARNLHLLRVWNYFPGINRDADGLERYKQFCVGRHDALAADSRMRDAPPAACAVGTEGGDFVLYFIAARSAGIAIENPRQVSAYHYPVEYGPRSPSFSRAVRHDAGNGWCLYLSGTASIVGHRTLHVGDVDAQLDETLRNIDAVAARAGAGNLSRVAAGAAFKVYVRHASDCARVARRLANVIGDAPVMYLCADICRTELLLEIEAVIPLVASGDAQTG